MLTFERSWISRWMFRVWFLVANARGALEIGWHWAGTQNMWFRCSLRHKELSSWKQSKRWKGTFVILEFAQTKGKNLERTGEFRIMKRKVGNDARFEFCFNMRLLCSAPNAVFCCCCINSISQAMQAQTYKARKSFQYAEQKNIQTPRCQVARLLEGFIGHCWNEFQ